VQNQKYKILMLGDYHQFPEIILRSVVVYLIILAGFRLAGKRHISQLSLVDFALILLISNAVQNAMVGNDTSLAGGIIAAVSLLVTNLILTKFIFKSKSTREFFVGEPKLLVRNSIVIQSAMDSEELSEEDLTEAIREHGFDSLKDVRTAILELDGSISIIPYPQNGEHVDEHHLAPIIRKRRGRKRIL
ncbi:MAG: DUF421 domain-containing protein, partial [Candidatus Kapaibacterium sp.]